MYHDEYIYVWQLVESFKTCPGFEDIENSTSLSLSLLTSDFLRKESSDSQSGIIMEPYQEPPSDDPQRDGNDLGGSPSYRSTGDKASVEFAQQRIYVPYLILLSVLYCKATPRARATKFYELVQMELTPHVGCHDKELKDYFRKIL